MSRKESLHRLFSWKSMPADPQNTGDKIFARFSNTGLLTRAMEKVSVMEVEFYGATAKQLPCLFLLFNRQSKIRMFKL